MAAPRAKRAGEKCAGKPRLQSLQARKCTGRDDRIRFHDKAASTWRSTSVSSPDSDIDRASQVGLFCFSRERCTATPRPAGCIDGTIKTLVLIVNLARCANLLF